MKFIKKKKKSKKNLNTVWQFKNVQASMCQIKTLPSQTEKAPFSLAQPVHTATVELGAAAALISNSFFLLNFICFLSSCVPKVNNHKSQTA